MEDNITVGKKHNFRKYGKSVINDYGIPYDYSSVMHYAFDAFGKGKMTIKTLDPKKQYIIGQRHSVTASDILLVKKLYGCNDTGN